MTRPLRTATGRGKTRSKVLRKKLMSMKAVLFSFTRRGTTLSLTIAAWLTVLGWDVQPLTTVKFATIDRRLRVLSPDLRTAAGAAFEEAQLLVFIGAAGITVRAIAPYVKSKETDPAVVVIDEKGHFVIPILSGHIGGANDMARRLADLVHGHAVLTTATDVNHRFAVDEWAARSGLAISSMREAKAFSAGLLETGRAGVYSDFPIVGPLPQGLEVRDSGPLGLAVTLRPDCYPFTETVVLRPRIIHIGIGCRKGIYKKTIGRVVLRELRRLQLPVHLIARVASIDVKASEEGLLAFAKDYGLPLVFYSANELNSLGDQGFASSDFVLRTVGTDNVCERAAYLSSNGGPFLLHKTVADGVTLAIAREDFSVQFTKTE